jgi:hypothetical protein
MAGREQASLRTRERIRPSGAPPSSTPGITRAGNGYGWPMRRLFRSLVRLAFRTAVLAAVGAVIKRLLEGPQPAPVADGWAPTALTQPTSAPPVTGTAANAEDAAAPDEVDTPATDGEPGGTAAKKAAPKKEPAKKSPAKKAAAKKAPAKKAAPKQGGSEEE